MAEAATTDNKTPTVSLGDEIVTIKNDVTNLLLGFVLEPRDEVLLRRGAGKGLLIYQDLKRDPHVKGVLRKRNLAVIARDPIVTPASENPLDVKAANLVKAAIAGFPFDRFTFGMMDSVLNGYAVGEIIWQARPLASMGDATFVVPENIKVRNPRRFKFDIEGNLRLLTPEQRFNGILLPDRKFIVQRFGEEETEDPYGLGLGNALFWPVFFKRKGIEFWFKFVERFGQPTIIGKYPAGAGAKEKKTLREAIIAISHETGIEIPEGMNIEFLESISRNNVNTHDQLCAYMDSQISEAVLGETLSTNIGDTGSMAAASTHNDVREELTDADCELVCDTLNDTLVKWLIEINLPGAKPPTISRDAADQEDLVARATRDKTISDMGFEPSLDYITNTYGGEWTKSAKPPAPQFPPGGFLPRDPAFAEPGASPRDVVDDLSDQAQTVAARAQDKLIAPFKALLEQCETLQEFGDKVLKLAPQISSADLASVLGEAMALSELQGRADMAARGVQ